jgi:hypothetical protein
MYKGRSVQSFEEKPKGNMALERPRHRWEDNIKTDLQEIDWDSMKWVDLVKNRNL